MDNVFKVGNRVKHMSQLDVCFQIEALLHNETEVWLDGYWLNTHYGCVPIKDGRDKIVIDKSQLPKWKVYCGHN